MGNTPPSSPPLGLPPPIGISSEVALMEASSEYDDISSWAEEGVSISGSDDLLSGFHHDQLFEFSGRFRTTLFQSLGQSDGGPLPSTLFSMASLKSIVSFLSSGSNIEPNLGIIQDDIFEKDATTEVCIIGLVSNMDVGELKPETLEIGEYLFCS